MCHLGGNPQPLTFERQEYNVHDTTRSARYKATLKNSLALHPLPHSWPKLMNTGVSLSMKLKVCSPSNSLVHCLRKFMWVQLPPVLFWVMPVSRLNIMRQNACVTLLLGTQSCRVFEVSLLRRSSIYNVYLLAVSTHPPISQNRILHSSSTHAPPTWTPFWAAWLPRSHTPQPSHFKWGHQYSIHH